jgi:hypothetical protein
MKRPLGLTLTGVVAFVLMAVPASARSNPSYRVLGGGGEVAQVIDSAISEVLVSSAVLRARPVAEALRRAAVERGVPVFVLVSSGGASERASFAKSLALAGVQVRTGEAMAVPMLVVDRRVGVTGTLVGNLAMRAGETATVRSDDPRYIAQLVRAFVAFYRKARPFQPGKVGP